jgi:hypothetical protein
MQGSVAAPGYHRQQRRDQRPIGPGQPRPSRALPLQDRNLVAQEQDLGFHADGRRERRNHAGIRRARRNTKRRHTVADHRGNAEASATFIGG